MRPYDRMDTLGPRHDNEEVEVIEVTTTYVAPVTETTDDIRADIEHTRAEMSSTLEAIQERLNPQTVSDQVAEQVKETVGQVTEHVKEQVRETVGHVTEQVKEQVHDATIGRAEHMVSYATESAREAGSSVMDRIRANPIPASLVALGLGWLYMSGSSGQQDRNRYRGSRGSNSGGERGVGGRGYDERDDWTYSEGYRSGGRGYGMRDDDRGSVTDSARHAASQVGRTTQNAGSSVAQGASNIGSTVVDRATDLGNSVAESASNVASAVADRAEDLTNNVRDTASRVGETVYDRAQDVTEGVSYGAERVKSGFEELLYDNPLAVGAIAAAVGATIGLLAPSTERENEFMGEARDNFVHKAQDVAHDTMGKVQRVTEEVKDTVREGAQDQGLIASNSGQQSTPTQPSSPSGRSQGAGQAGSGRI